MRASALGILGNSAHEKGPLPPRASPRARTPRRAQPSRAAVLEDEVAHQLSLGGLLPFQTLVFGVDRVGELRALPVLEARPAKPQDHLSLVRPGINERHVLCCGVEREAQERGDLPAPGAAFQVRALGIEAVVLSCSSGAEAITRAAVSPLAPFRDSTGPSLAPVVVKRPVANGHSANLWVRAVP